MLKFYLFFLLQAPLRNEIAADKMFDMMMSLMGYIMPATVLLFVLSFAWKMMFGGASSEINNSTEKVPRGQRSSHSSSRTDKIKCAYCRTRISATAAQCPHCGASV